MTLIIHLIVLGIAFYLLSFVSDKYFVSSLEKISEKMRLSSEVVGATFMAIWSSAPELFTSIFAIFAIFWSGGNENIWAGTIVGSAIFNILVIIGLSLIFTPNKKKLHWQPIIRDLVFYSLTILTLILVFWDGKVVFWESGLFVVIYGIYIWVVSQWGKWLDYRIEEVELLEQEKQKDKEEEKESQLNIFLEKIFTFIIPNVKKYYWWTFVVSIILIGLLSHQMVESAVEVSLFLWISKTIIGLTVLAAGTSIPDAISSIIVAKNGKISMSFTNALGSNVFDILFGLGAVYFVYFLIYGIDTHIAVDNHNLISSMILLLATVVVIFSVLVLKKRQTNKNIWYFLCILYLIYIWYTIYLAL